ncbi:MAG: hypothetical protein CMN73_01665 [Sphingomonas sp.]|nr:hypothetical protein [Sphingomonas sp.]
MLGMILSFALPYGAQPPAPERVELPVHRVSSGNGPPRFSVTVTINGQPVEAALDTGSVGLRVVGSALPSGGRETGQTVGIGFNSGVQLSGRVVRASVSFGDLPEATVALQRIDQATCRSGVPRCDATGSDMSSFRIMSEGVPGQGFVAILGIGLRPERLGHPLGQAGVTRWIVELPRSAAETGKLILNPTDAEVAGYRQVALLPDKNEVRGCIRSETHERCAPTMIDSGAPGITLFGADAEDLPAQGTEATLSLGEGDDSPSMTVTIGRRDQGGAARIRPARPDAPTSFSFGIAPYLHWSILYDSQARTLGVSDR